MTMTGQTNNAAKEDLDCVVTEIPEHHWEMLRPVFAGRGAPLPDARTSVIVGAFSTREEDSGALMAFAVLQRTIHAEPFVVFPAYEGRNFHRAIYDHIDLTLAAQAAASGFPDDTLSYFVTIDDEAAALARRLERRGFVRVGTLWRKDVSGQPRQPQQRESGE